MYRELDTDEQQRMTVHEAGKIYDGYFIFFTNSGESTSDGTDMYAIPRVISLTNMDFVRSGLYDKYKDQSKYGAPLFCPFFMATENVPPVLSF